MSWGRPPWRRLEREEGRRGGMPTRSKKGGEERSDEEVERLCCCCAARWVVLWRVLGMLGSFHQVGALVWSVLDR